MNNDRVDGDNQIGRLIFARYVDNDDALVDADLGRCQTDPRGGIHGCGHVPDEFADRIVNNCYRGGFFPELGVRVGENSANHSVAFPSL